MTFIKQFEIENKGNRNLNDSIIQGIKKNQSIKPRNLSRRNLIRINFTSVNLNMITIKNQVRK